MATKVTFPGSREKRVERCQQTMPYLARWAQRWPAVGEEVLHAASLVADLKNLGYSTIILLIIRPEDSSAVEVLFSQTCEKRLRGEYYFIPYITSLIVKSQGTAVVKALVEESLDYLGASVDFCGSPVMAAAAHRPR
ncbi:hypothetical protein PoB_000618600 [Plakobranchus ocellatus]|uniref:Uncharacterized protein n=1 Tax=Plakobranchus ocellatus TaxID=259542 RepID=A0AAV3Y8Y6_9GAST|nr:hypothetical protein PoB_000618600 [Plakobranchus ocellatus]